MTSSNQSIRLEEIISTLDDPNCQVLIHTFRGPGRPPTLVSHGIQGFFESDLEKKGEDFRFRWFHVPLNDTELAEKCLRKVKPDIELDESTWNWKLRPALSSIQPPSHATRMEPSCDYSEPQTLDGRFPLATLYLPFMVYDTYQNYQKLRTYYEARDLSKSQSSRRSERMGMRTNPLHPRRTLDQFFYPSVANTAARDADQTLSKWTGNDLGPEGRRRAEGDSLLILIDQLWCWVLDQETIVSFFPSSSPQGSTHEFHDLYRSISGSIFECETVWDLYALLCKEASTYLFTSENRRHVDLIETYRWVNNKKAADQTTYFQEFQQAQYKQASSLDDKLELELFLEVADIIDELKMIKHLVQQQRAVLEALITALRSWAVDDEAPKEPMGNIMNVSNNKVEDGYIVINIYSSTNDFGSIENTKILASRIASVAKSYVIYTEETLARLAVDLEAVQNDAEYTQKLLLGLLDLKQKTASLAEARSTTKQGGAIMLFTIVTVIFLPLSFFTSFFGQNVSEITGDGQNPTTWDLWKLATPISIVIIVLALGIAFYIVNPTSRLWFWRRRRWRPVKDIGQILV
ncbi:hypothetical protein F5Y10DRAFT_255444 [Nemania abortiva]|nr:hypothetical protein F5Y10DRAFT_255444 [Nemania abortiva]